METPKQPTAGELFYKSEDILLIREKLTEVEFNQFTELVKQYLVIKKTEQEDSDPFMVDVFNFLKRISTIDNLNDKEYDELFMSLTYLLYDL